MGSPSSRRYQRTRARRSLASGGEMSHGRCAELPSTDTTDVISGTEREGKGRWIDLMFNYASMVLGPWFGGHFEHSWQPSSRRNLASSDTRAARGEENGSRVSCRRSVKKGAAKAEQSRKELDRGTWWDDGTLNREKGGRTRARPLAGTRNSLAPLASRVEEIG